MRAKMKPVAYQNQKRQYTLNYFIHKIGNLMTLEKNALQKSWKILFNETIDEKSLSDIEKICIDSLESERRISDLISSDIDPMHKIPNQILPGK